MAHTFILQASAANSREHAALDNNSLRELELENLETPREDAAQDSEPAVAGTQVQRTYSRRGRKAQVTVQPDGLRQSEKPKRLGRKKTVRPGEIVLPTPIIRRARGQHLSSPIQQPPLAGPGAVANGRKRLATLSGHRTSSVIAGLESEMQSLRTRYTATRFCLYEALLRALHSLLMSTAEPAPRSTGSKSLMAMCLRKVPDYIGELEYWEQRDAEETGTKSALQNSDVSGQVYDELQDMLPTSHGSSHLRTVVRAHGIKVIRDSIAEGLVDDRFASLLLDLCCRTKSFQEGEELLQELVNRSYPKPKRVDSSFDENRKLAPLKTLRRFAAESNRPQVLMRQFSKLISQQLLPVDWLSTKEFGSIWSSMVKSLSAESSCDDTVSFAVEVIASLSGQAKAGSFSRRPQIDDRKTLSQQTLLSAITSVATLPILSQEARDMIVHPTGTEKVSVISRRVEFIIQTCIYHMRRVRRSSWISTIMTLAAYLTSTAHRGSKVTDAAEVWCRIQARQNSADVKQDYEAATSIISSIAQCCGRGTSRPSHHYLAKFCDQLDQGNSVEAPSTNIRSDCAFFLAERTNDLRDLAFAESLEPSGTQHTIHLTPGKDLVTSSFSGYRWEEDICEWVIATPAPQRMSRRPSPSPTETTRLDADGETWRGSAKETENRELSTDGLSSEGSEEGSTQLGSKLKVKRDQATGATLSCSDHVYGRSGGQRFTRLGKRSLGASGLLSLLDDDEVLELPCSSHGSRCNGEYENKMDFYGTGAKKRRTTALKQAHTVLKSITHAAHDDCSDDELGL
ncbi:hypothetical protein SLS53_009256 [Cytospora paraplurivora]|uniref:Uncharacterized protein n=1 Tax=Cytospora paraplurivora TaxID=2898453 RepID=A0AAN9YC33_9PEZI